MNEADRAIEEDQKEKNAKEGESLIKEFMKKKKDMLIERLKTETYSKINQLIQEAKKKKEEAFRLEQEAIKLEQEAKMLKQNEPKMKKKILDEIKSEEKKELKKFKDGIELSNLSDRLKLFGIEVKSDVKEYNMEEEYK